MWQPTECSASGSGGGGSGGGSSGNSASIVKFPFERKSAKELLVELELFDKVFLQKRDLVRLNGRLRLEQLLPPLNSKTSQSVIQLHLESGGNNSGAAAPNGNAASVANTNGYFFASIHRKQLAMYPFHAWFITCARP